MPQRFSLALAALAVGLCCACGGGSTPCKATTDCAANGSGGVCVDGQCVTPPAVDSGTPDSGTPDSGTPDAGTADAGTPDSGTPDSGTPDSGTPDAGTADAGTPDGGTADAGTPDSGTPDSGTSDSGTPDAGTPDAGAPDAGPTCSSNAQCSGATAICDLATHQCVQCTSSNASACAWDQTCATDQCAEADAGGSSSDLATVDAYAVDGGLPAGTTLDVSGPLVTYLKTSESASDPAGFFVQAEQTGPALFVAATGASVGDRVSFTVTSATSWHELPEANGVANLTVLESGHDVSPLASDVSGIDFNTANLDPLAGVLITLDSEVAGQVTPANTGYEQAPLTTAGFPSPSATLRFYAPTHVFTDDAIQPGCALHFSRGILWRYYTSAQPAVWQDGDVSLGACVQPVVTGADSSDPTTVTVSFSEPLDPSTVNSGAFAISGLTVSNAVLDATNSVVTLTTSSQSPGAWYYVQVAGTVTDSIGAPLGSPNSARFIGFSSEATFRLTEVNPDVDAGSGGDLVELYAVKGGTTTGVTVQELVGQGTVADFSNGPSSVATGDVVVLHLDNFDNTCPESTTKDQCPAASYPGYSDSAWDLVGSQQLKFSSRVLAVVASDGGTSDAVPFTKPSVTPPGGFPSTVQSIENAGLWKPTGSGTCDGGQSSCEADSVDWTKVTADGTVSAQHVPGFGPPPDDKTAWTVGTATWGEFTDLDGGTSEIPDSGTPDSGTPDAGSSDAGVEVKIGEWNLEWFGDPDAGPNDDDLQQANVQAVMADAGADLWGIEEVVDTTRFANVVNALPGGYAAVVAKDSIVDGGSYYSGTQQVALVYRAGEAQVTGAQLICTANAADFAGRPPLEVALLFRNTSLYVIVLHMKAFATQSAWQKRVNASTDLKAYLDTYRANDRVIVLGDWNDDIDESIVSDGAGGYLASPYANFVSDSSQYEFTTSPLTYAPDGGTSTTVTNFGNGPIDHHMVTNELFGNIETNSATVLHPAITNYGTTTSDHYPTFVYQRW